MELLQPHAPALSESRGLPELERCQGHRNDLCNSTLALKLGKKAHLRNIEGGYLLEKRLSTL